jgi:hypothetical protein
MSDFNEDFRNVIRAEFGNTSFENEVLRRVVRGVIRTVRKWSRLADDLLGEESRPGLPEGRPGLLERVGRIESKMAAVEAVVLKELRPNGGSSIKDQVAKVADKY